MLIVKASCGNSSLFTKNFAGANGTEHAQVCVLKGIVRDLSPATHGDGVCATVVVDRIVRRLGMSEHSCAQSRTFKGGAGVRIV